MNKKFVLSIAILGLLVSCREAEEVMDNINANHVSELRKQSEDENNVLGFNSQVAKDSTNSSLEGEVKPPVKDGGHWKQ